MTTTDSSMGSDDAPSVGMVLVSHCRKLAETAADFVRQMSQGGVRIAFAGGAGPDHAELGTDATDIMEAIQAVDSGEGVLVLTDLGSAILSAAMAVELLDGIVENIRLAPAPLIEGALAAAVQISAGSDMDAAILEAKTAIRAKASYIESGHEDLDEDENAGRELSVPQDAERVRFVVTDPDGLHVRPAVILIKALRPFSVEARIRNLTSRSPYVSAMSLNQMALSAIGSGDKVEMAVWGDDAEKAVAALASAAENLILADEVEIRGRRAGRSHSTRLTPAIGRQGGYVHLAPGIASGELYVFQPIDSHLPSRSIADPSAEEERFVRVVTEVGRELRENAKKEAPKDELLALHDAQIMILEDPEIIARVRKEIRIHARDAASLYQAAMDDLAFQYRSLATPYLRARAADVQAVADKVLRKLMGLQESAPDPNARLIVYAPEIGVGHVLRSETAIVGALTTIGGPTSHATLAMVANGVPFIGGVTLPAEAKTGDRVLMDAFRGEVVFNPTQKEEVEFVNRQKRWAEALARNIEDSRGPAVTRDGLDVLVCANVGDMSRESATGGCEFDGIGLVRTEFAFLGSIREPKANEQVRRLHEVFSSAQGKSVIVRTLDVGGDKNLPWLGLPKEANPFLGIRGIRLAWRRRDLLKTQIEAILIAGADFSVQDGKDWNIGIMVPMVATMAEIDLFEETLADSRQDLVSRGIQHVWPVGKGIMMETPAAVFQAEEIARRVDFMSIGSNDLTQYVMSAERGSSDLSYLTDGLHPAVLRAIDRIAAAGRAAGIPVSLCGELAADPAGARALLGLGITRLSVDVHSVGIIKRLVRSEDSSRLFRLAREALDMNDARTVRAMFTVDTDGSGSA